MGSASGRSARQPQGVTTPEPVEAAPQSNAPAPSPAAAQAPGPQSQSLTVTDNRTGRSYQIPIHDGTIRAMDLRQIKTGRDDFGLMSYDPAFTNTAACRSAITEIDGEKGILNYRGYPIEQLAEQSTYLETAYLILHGELPTQAQHEEWVHNITHHTILHESIKKFIDGFRYDAHPMGMLISTVAAMSTFYKDVKEIFNPKVRREHHYRLLAKVPTLAAFSYRHSVGLPFAYPDNELSYTGNFLNMLFKMTEVRYKPNPIIERALDVLFILHADHEQNCSTSAMRGVGSSHVDPYSAVAAAVAALYGPLHGGANEMVLRMLSEIGSVSRVPEFVKRVKAGEMRLMGFGHRVYKNYDPRAKIIKRMADQVFEVTGNNPLLDIALELERIALQDEYFVQRKLYPNVDFYSGLIYQGLRFPVEMFPVLFAIPRTVGWLAQWEEMLLDPEQKIARPRQVYTGRQRRDYVPMESRG
jgi:citrate synthase